MFKAYVEEVIHSTRGFLSAPKPVHPKEKKTRRGCSAKEEVFFFKETWNVSITWNTRFSSELFVSFFRVDSF